MSKAATAAPNNQAAKALALLRIGAGAGAWLAPNLAARMMGLQQGPSQALALRLFGVRDLVMGLGYLAAAAGPHGSAKNAEDNWLRMGIVADAGDAIASLAAVRAGGVPARTGIPMMLTAAAAVAVAARASRPAPG